MSNHLAKAVSISELSSAEFWVIYGKSGSGKTGILGSFPKPMLYLRFGDDGSDTISDEDGIDGIDIIDIPHLKEILIELRLNKKYKTIAVDTFSLLTQEWIDTNAVKKNKRMTQNMWGEIKTETEEMIKLANILAKTRVVVFTCHEVSDSFEGYEDEIVPDVRPSTTKGARTYLESMANYGIHTTVVEREEEKNGKTITVYKHMAHIGPNPYYWTKTQKSLKIRLPKLVVNPTYNKIKSIVKGERKNGKS